MESNIKTETLGIFLLVYGLPSLIQIIMAQGFVDQFQILAYDGAQNNKLIKETLTNMFDYMITFIPITIGIPLFIIFIWLMAVGLELQSKIPVNLQKNTTLFVIINILGGTLIMLTIYQMINFFNSLIYTMMQQIENENMQNLIPDFSTLALIQLLFLTAIFCYIYVIYFAAKTIKTAENKTATKFEDFVAEFFLIVFFPIGIWILQPRINRMINANKNITINQNGEIIREIDEML